MSTGTVISGWYNSSNQRKPHRHCWIKRILAKQKPKRSKEANPQIKKAPPPPPQEKSIKNNYTYCEANRRHSLHFIASTPQMWTLALKPNRLALCYVQQEVLYQDTTLLHHSVITIRLSLATKHQQHWPAGLPSTQSAVVSVCGRLSTPTAWLSSTV